jgi:hypothetical protein
MESFINVFKLPCRIQTNDFKNSPTLENLSNQSCGMGTQTESN